MFPALELDYSWAKLSAGCYNWPIPYGECNLVYWYHQGFYLATHENPSNNDIIEEYTHSDVMQY
jgi:hypothetical protein